MHTNYPRHLAGFSYIGGYRYSLTFCTEDRAEWLVDPEAVELVATQILRAARDTSFAVTAYCVMPDHVHLVVEGLTDAADLKRFVHRAKQFSGYRYSQRWKRRLWQRYSYERVLRTEEHTSDVVRYVLENPVRAGLAKHPTEYPHLGSSVYSVPELLQFAYETTTVSGPAKAGRYDVPRVRLKPDTTTCPGSGRSRTYDGDVIGLPSGSRKTMAAMPVFFSGSSIVLRSPTITMFRCSRSMYFPATLRTSSLVTAFTAFA